MKLSNVLKISTLGLSLLSTSIFAGTLHQVSNAELPRAVEVVDQNQYPSMPSYSAAGTTNQWYLCGHGAFASAFNILRGTAADDAAQLEWFHQKLLQKPLYTESDNLTHYEASGDELAAIVNTRNDFTAAKTSQIDRDKIKQKLHDALDSSATQQVIALTKKQGWGHFVVVHEIYYNPGGVNGGHVKFADPWGGVSSNTMGYTNFLNGMRDEGTPGRYSFWTIKAK
ncbi:MAG: hypothetical protein HRT35_29265 [Algicola sp.]|nr:hypothetical protein [Algicola sp.]